MPKTYLKGFLNCWAATHFWVAGTCRQNPCFSTMNVIYGQTIAVTPLHVTALQYSLLFW